MEKRINENQYTFVLIVMGILVVLALFLIALDFISPPSTTGKVTINSNEGMACFTGTCSLYYKCGEHGTLEKNTCTVNRNTGFCDPIEQPQNCAYVEEVCTTKKVSC